MIRARVVALLTAIATVSMGAGCKATGGSRAREYMPDMVRGPAYQAFSPNPATADGLTLRQPVPGTLARGQRPFHFGAGEDEAIRAGEALSNPYPATASVLNDGEGLFGIYCTPCHGPAGDGEGPLAGKIPTPPPYRSSRVLELLPGQMFHVLTLGSGKMPAQAAQLSPDERWKVITYVRTTLQGLEKPWKEGP